MDLFIDLPLAERVQRAFGRRGQGGQSAGPALREDDEAEADQRGDGDEVPLPALCGEAMQQGDGRGRC